MNVILDSTEDIEPEKDDEQNEEIPPLPKFKIGDKVISSRDKDSIYVITGKRLYHEKSYTYKYTYELCNGINKIRYSESGEPWTEDEKFLRLADQ